MWNGGKRCGLLRSQEKIENKWLFEPGGSLSSRALVGETTTSGMAQLSEKLREILP